MPYLNQTKFAELIEVSRPSVSTAIKEGRVIATAHGIDPLHPTNLYYAERVKENPHWQAAHKKKLEAREKQLDKEFEDGVRPEPPAEKKTPKKKQYPVTYKKKNVVPLSAATGRLDLAVIDRSNADRLKVIEQIKALQVKTDQIRSKLITRESVQRAFSKSYQVDCNEFKTLPDILAPNIASLCKIDDPDVILEIKTLIEKHIYQVLKHKKRIIDDFFKDLDDKQAKMQNETVEADTG